MNDKSILWISAAVPYDKVPHAGGKIHNYYIKFLKAHSDCKLKLLSFYWAKEKEKIDLDSYGIDYDLIERKIWHLPDLLINAESILNPWNRYAGINQNYIVMQLRKKLSEYKKQNTYPDIVLLQWTEMVVLIDVVKQYFPNAKYIAIEEEVKFLGYERKANDSKGLLRSLFNQVRYNKLKAIELKACATCDRVILNNPKDKDLLLRCGLNENILMEWQPYFDSFIDNPYLGHKKYIIFYGAMGRHENEEAALWLIHKVLPLIKDPECEILIIGSSPTAELKTEESRRVHILGFVDDIGSYFKEGLCFAAPLHKGAGIKIKILESMSSGIPVLTTDIGIEGIPAENGKEYFHCDSAQEYATVIDKLVTDEELRKSISVNAKRFIRDRFDLQKSGERFLETLHNI